MLLGLVLKGKEEKQTLLIVFPHVLILLLVLFTSASTHNVTSFICTGSLHGNEALDLFKANFHNLSLNLIKFYGNTLVRCYFPGLYEFYTRVLVVISTWKLVNAVAGIFFWDPKTTLLNFLTEDLKGLLMCRKMKA